ncbi:MAG: M20/M25/M40 family metallo-hydrolase, partial [Actinobacteria bacterium]|nr:M20/M25/M40 family metallo-hydrolase [Actinomycetota bacterium]
MAAKDSLLAALVVAVVAALVVVGVTPLGVSPPAPERSAAGGFSAGRAMVLLRAIAAAPRPMGSEGAAQARDAIVAELKALHLASHVQTASAVAAQSGRVAGTVSNVVARLPGSDPSRAVLLVAHYDSVPVAAGAADDGGGVVTLLETARAMASGPRPRNDIIFLFTDGEERGLLGARAFLREEPWAYGVGVVLNFDSPGSSSPVLMYETSAGNGLLVREFVAAAPRPHTSSLMFEVSRRLPIASDFRPFVAAGVPGMSFGALDGPAFDHTAYDSLESFHARSLQHEGDTALALARHFGGL